MTELNLQGSTNLTIKLIDTDTAVEVVSSVSIMTGNQREARRLLVKAFAETLDKLWPMEPPKETSDDKQGS